VLAARPLQQAERHLVAQLHDHSCVAVHKVRVEPIDSLFVAEQDLDLFPDPLFAKLRLRTRVYG
jgi:hypothetical protein